MLVLTRCKKQTIIVSLGDVKATLTILDTRYGRCKVGIEAPLTVAVVRGELRAATLDI